jgi:hypothetical protein
MPYVDDLLVPEAQTSAIIGSHNSAGEAESKFLTAVKAAVIEFRSAKGI